MTLLSEASFLVTPNGYKASKLYAAIPTNGNGDMTVTRATTATRVDENDLVSSVASNVPRIDYTGGGCPSILLEPQRTNLVLRSQEFDSTSWVHNANITVTSSSELAPNGNLEANLIEYDGSGYSFIRRTINATPTVATLSVFAKKGNWRYLGLRNFQTSGTHTVFDFDTETFANIASGQTASFEIFSNGWYRIKVTQPSPEANNYVGFAITNSSGIELDATGGQVANIHLWGAQLEEGSYPTSYIPTVASTVTRLKDECTNGGNADLFNDSEGTVFVDLENFDTPSAQLTLSNGFSTNRITFIFRGSEFAFPNTIRFYLASAGSAQVDSQYNISYTFNQRNKIAFKYKQNDFKIYINGTQVYSDTSGNTPIGLSRFDFASSSSTSGFIEGKINQAMVFNEALSDSELQTLTTL